MLKVIGDRFFKKLFPLFKYKVCTLQYLWKIIRDFIVFIYVYEGGAYWKSRHAYRSWILDFVYIFISLYLDISLKKSYKMEMWTNLQLFVDWLYQ